MNRNQQQDEITISLSEILKVLRRKMLVIIAFAIFFAMISAFVNIFIITPKYSSTTKLYVIGSDTITSISDLQIGSSLTKDYIQLIQSRPVVQTVIDNLELNYTYNELVSEISITNPTDTRMLNITVTDEDPYLSKEIADEFAKVSIEKIHEIMLAEEPRMVEDGVVDTRPVSPNKKKNILTWTALGTLVVMFIIIISYLLDDTLKSEDDIEDKLGLTTLGEIPLEEQHQPLFKDERFNFINKLLEPLRKDFRKLCRKLPLARFKFLKNLARKLTRR